MTEQTHLIKSVFIRTNSDTLQLTVEINVFK